MSTPVIAVFTKNRTNPAYTAARLGADRTGAWLGARIVHYVPRRPDSIEDQARRVEQAIGERADAVVFVPVHATAMNESVGIRDTGYGFEAKAGEAGLPHYVSLISHLVSRILHRATLACRPPDIFMRDKTVAILESRLGAQLAELVGKHGGRPFLAPALAEVPEVDPASLAALVGALEAQAALFAVFQTGVGTHALFKATDSLGLTAKLLALLERMTVVVRGPKPTAALRSRSVRIDISAREPFTTVEVLDSLQAVKLSGARVIVQRYGVSNAELEEALKSRGAQVIEITTYRWSLPENTRPLVELLDKLERREIDAVTVTNAAQVYNLFAVAEKLGRTDALRAGLNRTLVASVGPVSSDALKKFGVAVGVEPRPPKLGPLVAALDAALSADPKDEG